ncbi:CLUMA_CG011946, isoform A [Clunio marinus]|uniref:CLUMA_CG011946, isoform A n=1 Tax=Clunio marinus TaxID=568069 RepID=A0A1J1IFS9_9DIPT|nr:CLUMA_CG011946, isoform A [Clunio marinus]
MDFKWKCLKFERNDVIKIPKLQNCNFDHPLKDQKVMMFDSKGTRNRLSMLSSVSSSKSSLDPLSSLDGLDDPLSQFARQEIDPLSQMAAELEATSISNNSKQRVKLEPSIESWSSRRAVILNKYTTSERLSIATSFLGGENVIKNQSTVEKVKHRLEQLDDFQDIHYMQNLTQQEYMAKIQLLNSELVAAWRTDQRVKSLKIAIQCSKLLADPSSVMQFYPSKFVLITDILDIFGKLVYDRLKSKSENEKSLPENFSPDMIPESAKETCLNWFYKIASIRELLPRLYVEMCLIRCYKFINPKEIDQSLQRISKMIRGVGDPLVAAYARCYLIRIGISVSNNREYMKETFVDFLATYQTIFITGIRAELLKQNMSLSVYLSLYTPALDWIVQNFSSNASDITLEDILNQCSEKKNNSLLLMTILHSFRPEFLSFHSIELVGILADATNEGISRGALFRQLGNILSLFPPPLDQRLMVLNEAWKTINTITNISDYISCVELWSQYVAANFDTEIINKFLGDILIRVTQKRAFERYYAELQGIVDKIVTNVRDFEGLMVMDNFLPLIDLFQKESIKIDVCKNILQKYKMFCGNEEFDVSTSINDPVIINAFMCVTKVLNDGVNALTTEDERRFISNLISFFILRVNYGRDFEQQLSFYVDARASFPNLDSVLFTLVNCVNKLSMDTRTIVKGNHTRKTGPFVKACVAYSFITIPTIISTMQRLDLYLLTGEVALANMCLGQADACLEAALNLIPEMPKTLEVDGRPRSSEFYLQSYVTKFLSLLLVVPDSPEQGVLYLLRLLLEKIKEFQFESVQGSLAFIYINVLDVLCWCAQGSYPYHFHNVVSNDQLYGSDPKFINEINEISTEIVDELLVIMKSYSDKVKLQSSISLELFERVSVKADLNDDKIFQLALNLWNLSIKHRQTLDPKAHMKMIQHLMNVKASTRNKDYCHRMDELINRIKSKL